MADFGFGHAPFGRGRFGVVDINRDTLYNRSLPTRIQDDDNGDLQSVTEAYAKILDFLIDGVRELPKQFLPLFSRSSRENSQTLTITAQQTSTTGATLLLTVDEADKDKLLVMWANRTQISVKGEVFDGWSAIIENQEQVITAIDYDLGTLTVLTSSTLATLPSTIEVFPPELLSLIGDTVGVFVDRLDPPDFTRRALQRHRLISDLKVSKRLFTLIGRIYGFDINVDGLFCIDEARFNALRLTNPTEIFEFPANSGNYYTTIRPVGFNFDEVPLDVMPLDNSEPIVVGNITVTAVPQERDPANLGNLLAGTNFYAMPINPGDEIFFISSPDRSIPVRIELTSLITGETFLVERVDGPQGIIYVYSLTTPPEGAYSVRYVPRFQCRPSYKPGPAYRVTILPGEVLTEPGASFDRLVDRIEERVDTYIPIHIRTLIKVFQQQSTTQNIFTQNEIAASDQVVDTTSPTVLSGTLFDITALDTVPLDTGTFVITTTLILTP